jgi:hypothetical protein
VPFIPTTKPILNPVMVNLLTIIPHLRHHRVSHIEPLEGFRFPKGLPILFTTRYFPPLASTVGADSPFYIPSNGGPGEPRTASCRPVFNLFPLETSF